MADKKKKGNKLVKHIIFIIISIIAGLVLGVLFTSGSFDADGFKEAFGATATWMIAVAVYLVLVFAGVLTKQKGDSDKRSSGVGKTKEGEEMDEFADSRWVTLKELREESRFHCTRYTQLPNSKFDGIIIRAEGINNFTDVEVNMFKPMHTLIVGASGSGKTETFVFPALQIWPMCATKPSLFVSDPKGELYGKTSNHLRKCGYNVIVVDLRHPYESLRYNPLAEAYKLFQRSLHLEKEVKKYVGGKPNPKEFTLMKENYGDEWYAFNGVAFPNEELLKKDLLATKMELQTEAENELTFISQVLRPIENQHDPSWEKGAQGLIEGFLNAMLEESAHPEETGMTQEKFCLYNLAQMLSYKDTGEDNYLTLKNYCQGRPKESKVMPLVATALFNAPGTTKSYMGFVTDSMKIFQDMGINYLTSGNDIDVSRFAYDPTVIYFIVPDDNTTRHGIATMFITQLYKSLINEATKCNPSEPQLPKNVYFLLDEFANIPKIPEFDKKISVGRSRRVFFCLVVQSYSQLDKVYGEKDASTIRENCTFQIYIGTDDQKTREAFSKLCGEVSLEFKSENKSKDNKGESSGTSTSVSTRKRPLIYPDELGMTEMGTNIVKIFKVFPIKAAFTPSFKLKGVYDMSFADRPYGGKQFFDTNKYYYDFKRIANKNSGGGGGLSDEP